MHSNFKTFGKTLVASAVFATLGMGSFLVKAEQVPGYCGLLLCSDSTVAQAQKQLLGLGDAKLGWWDCRIQGKCQDLQSEIAKLKMDANDCSTEKLDKYRKDIADLNASLGEKLKKIGPEAEKSFSSGMEKGLTDDLIAHFKQCYAEGLFKPSVNTCVTADCQRIVSATETLKVDKADCSTLKNLYSASQRTWEFSYEKQLIISKIDAFKDKCVDADLYPAKEAYNHGFLKKDSPLAEQSEALEKKITGQLAVLKTTAEDCSMALYEVLSSDLTAFEKDLATLKDVAVNTTNLFDEHWSERPLEQLTGKTHEHFVNCERQKMFPANKNQCVSKECKESEAAIAAFPLDKESCKTEPEKFQRKTPFQFEGELIDAKLEAYKQKCIDADLLPYRRLNGDLVTKSEYMAAYKAFQEKVDNMGRHGEQTEFKEGRLLPFEELVAKVNALKINKKDCNFRKSISPLQANMRQYIGTWRKSGFGIPKEVSELNQKLNDKFMECDKKKLTFKPVS